MHECLQNSPTNKINRKVWEKSKVVWKLFTIEHGNILYFFLNFIHEKRKTPSDTFFLIQVCIEIQESLKLTLLKLN